MAKNDSVWSIEELVALTDEIQEATVEFKGKLFSFQYAELTEEEEPKMVPLGDGASDDEQADWYQKVGSERILAMIKKAHKENPDSTCLDKESWAKLPSTLRYKIIGEVLNLEGVKRENFPTG